jgi:glycerol-3-phosphate dehydrogenase
VGDTGTKLGPAGGPLEARAAVWRRFGEETFDLAVIGGGINGAAVARDAVLRGLNVALVERDDFASGTSSKSSKLIHGGVRYLEQGDIALVLEACRERDLLRTKIAPHLVRAQRFVFPVYDDDSLNVWTLRAGLLLYDVLAAFRNVEMHRGLSAARLSEQEPKLLRRGLQGGCLYYDCWTDDARLTIETAMAAKLGGAAVLNYVGVEGLEKDSSGRLASASLRDRVSGEQTTLRARGFINVTGPWLDRVRRMDDPAVDSRLKVTKGVHAIFDRSKIGNRDAIVIRGIDDRVMFAIPWQNQTLVGTTDTYFDGDPAEVAADRDDIEYILAAVNRAFPDSGVRASDVISSFAGLRPLVAPDQDRSESEVSRDDQIWESAAGLISLGGGKLTTHRHVAERLVDRAVKRLGRPFGPCRTASVPLPAAEGVAPGGPLETLPTSARQHLQQRYGSLAEDVVEGGDPSADRDERLVSDLPDLRDEVLHAVDRELAVEIDDILERRLKVALRSRERSGAVVEVVAEILGQRLGWDSSRVEEEVLRYRDSLAKEDAENLS